MGGGEVRVAAGEKAVTGSMMSTYLTMLTDTSDTSALLLVLLLVGAVVVVVVVLGEHQGIMPSSLRCDARSVHVRIWQRMYAKYMVPWVVVFVEKEERSLSAVERSDEQCEQWVA